METITKYYEITNWVDYNEVSGGCSCMGPSERIKTSYMSGPYLVEVTTTIREDGTGCEVRQFKGVG